MEETTNSLRFWHLIRLLAAAAILVAAAWPLLFGRSLPTSTVRSMVRGAVIGETTTPEEEKEIALRVENLWAELTSMVKDTSVLNPGASEQEVAKVENMLGVRLPPDYRAFLKICNGANGSYHGLNPPPQTIDQLTNPGRYNYPDYLPGFDRPQRLMIRPEEKYPNRVEVSDWHPALILIASIDGFGYALELESGKIIYWDHDGWSFDYRFESFEELLRETVKTGRESGTVKFW